MSSRKRNERYKVVWTRTRGGHCDDQKIRVKQNGGQWQEFESVDDLPEHIQQMVAGVIDEDDNILMDFDNDVMDDSSILDEEEYVNFLDGTHPIRTARHIGKSTTSGESLRLEYRWLEWLTFFGLMIAIGYLLYSAQTITQTKGFQFLLDCGAILLAIGCGYFALALLVNSSIIEVRDGMLIVRHGPMPWFGNRRIPISRVKQIFCRAFHTRHEIRYRVEALPEYGRSIVLLDDVRSKAEAISLERAIERHLGIKDWPRYGD